MLRNSILRIPIRQSICTFYHGSRQSILVRRSIATTPAICRIARPQIDQRIPQPHTLSKKPKSEEATIKVLENRLKRFKRDTGISKKLKVMGIDKALFDEIYPGFEKAVLAGKMQQCSVSYIRTSLGVHQGHEGVDRAILASFYEYAEPYVPESVIEHYRSMRKLSDLRFPGEWFPEARQMQRKIILHVGPTNSGKTYRALKRLEEAESGIYCGPLRLLAHEVFEKMNAKGITCNLLTGEEKRVMDEACLMTSSTVEMANLGRRMEVAVIDEIQMIGDPLRGWAWTQALLGLKAKEIHLCGEPAAVPLIKSICESLNEEVVVNEYERLTPVTINEASLNRNWTKIRKGDCVVAFSRSQIFEIKTKIEKETGLKCAVAYGALPPETRAMQARSFNDPESDVNVLVASDAVGMGLNLNIKRIIFSTVKKFDGHANRYMSIPQLKQIAGRAGRFGTTYANGQVTTMYPQDLNYVKMAMKAPIHYLKLAGLQPTVDMLEFFAVQMPQESFPNLLQKFEEMASVESSYFLCNFGDQKKIAEAINHVDLNLRDRYIISTAPVSTRNEQLLDTVARFAEMHSHSDTCTLDTVVTLPKQPPREPKSLQELELAHKTIMLYMWLALRFPETFVTEQDQALQIKEKCESLIDSSLRSFVKSGKKKTPRPKLHHSHLDSYHHHQPSKGIKVQK